MIISSKREVRARFLELNSKQQKCSLTSMFLEGDTSSPPSEDKIEELDVSGRDEEGDGFVMAVEGVGEVAEELVERISKISFSKT